MARSAARDLHCIRDFIRWGASRFAEAELCYGHGTDNPIDEAMALVLHAVSMQPDLPQELLLARLTAEEKERILLLFSRRITQRVPAAYLTGQAWFAGLQFRVDNRVLVPRSPIAELLEAGFQPWLDGDGVTRVLDVGTGSGCIAIACAAYLPDAKVDAVDISADALEVAQLNVDEHGVGDRVQLFISDGLDAARGPYDLIVSNPPYVDAHDMDSLAQEFRHEPALGLAAGEDGLDVVVGLLENAGEHLSDSGVLIVEVGASRPALVARYPLLPFLWLEFERGGDNVFLLGADDLRQPR
ncbi:MAG: 50S ribosomal protein L3 N(5)-glutamine methyltransferase [Gammaproteobacteria bacterium]|nr:50S ribosomal protein L3 N(5)-glutamine methyltransferase [Gammaproteobacteria bacterium]MDX2460648.1 50S ribosomal protein L3 N(5)-glutamine methyltransferase [Gammaproteobacteria bacterium]